MNKFMPLAALGKSGVLVGLLIAMITPSLSCVAGIFGDSPYQVNAPAQYPAQPDEQEVLLRVEADVAVARIDHRIFGSNLEWFNEAGGLASPNSALRDRLVTLAREQGISVQRFPGGILADYYHWTDGTGQRRSRPARRHPSDNGSSANTFGSPEFFEFLRRTGSQGLITVNAGTGTAEEAAAWVAYANRAGNVQRAQDGFAEPIGIKLWEVGNELYLPGNPTEQKITVTPEVYAERYLRFADAMRKADPSISVIAIGVAKSHIGPDTEFPDWTEKVLQRAAGEIDMIAVHNAYFPMLYRVKQPRVDQVYPALWASPEAVDESLAQLEELIARYEGKRRIGIAITEWGALYSLPRADPYWVDHVKTLGSGIYIARMLQVFMSHPRVQMANYFKFTDRSFMGWVDLNGQPKVPYWVFKLYARNSGDMRVKSSMTPSRTYNAPALAIMKPQSNVPELTHIVTRDTKSGRLYINLVNRSMSRQYTVNLSLNGLNPATKGELLQVSGKEPTAHNGRDIPLEWPFRDEYEPFTSAAPDSIRIQPRAWKAGEPLRVAPFSVVTLILDGAVTHKSVNKATLEEL